MSVQTIGNIVGSLIEQAEFEFVISKDNGTTVTSTWECDAANAVNLSPRIDSRHPLFSTCKCTEVRGRRSEGDRAIVTAIFKGLAPDSQPLPIYERISGTSEEPIETHYRYKDLTDAEFLEIKKWSADPSYEPQGLTDRGKELLKKKKRGQDTYLCRTLGYRETKVDHESDDNCSNVGYIDTPPFAPTLDGSANYLLVAYPQVKEGDSYRHTKEWRASGPQGWDADIYTKPA